MIAKTPQPTMSHKVVIEEPRLIMGPSQAARKERRARPAPVTGRSQIGADIAKNGSAVQRRRGFQPPVFPHKKRRSKDLPQQAFSAGGERRFPALPRADGAAAGR